MDNDKIEQIDVEEKSFKYQQLDPERFAEPRGWQGGPGRQEPPGRQGSFEPTDRSGMPLSAPPNFSPEMPRGGAQPYSFGIEDGMDFRRGGQNQNRSLRRCLNRFTFIWLFNGNSFWFYPIEIRRNQIEGFRWRNNRWIYDRINVRRILFFRCF